MAVVGSLAVMIATITLAHGVGPKSLAALLGTAGALFLTVGLAVLFTDFTHLTGLASEEATVLQVNGTGVELKGLLIAGMVIAALGVLDDVTISQSAIVLALRGANPGLRFPRPVRAGARRRQGSRVRDGEHARPGIRGRLAAAAARVHLRRARGRSTLPTWSWSPRRSSRPWWDPWA